VLPGAQARTIQREYEAKAALLGPGLIAGAAPDVVTAVIRAQDLLDTARAVLGDPESRRRYDQVAGLRRRRDRRADVPDFRGLFYRVCLEVATRHGLHVRIVRLTERPMAVDGLVVDQDPRPPSKVSRGGTLTVQLWHPPVRSRSAAGLTSCSIATRLPWRVWAGLR
jgi:hypothetical protein